MTRKSPSRFRFALMGVLAALVGVEDGDADQGGQGAHEGEAEGGGRLAGHF